MGLAAVVDAAVVRAEPSPEALLKAGPFFVVDAREAGLSWEALQGPRWTRMSRGQYAYSRLRRDTRLILRAVARRMPRGYAFSGRTAAWLLGLDMPPLDPIEVTIDREVPVRGRAGVKLRRTALSESDVIDLDGFRLTGPFRTIRDLGGGRDHVESVVAIEIGVRAGFVQLPEVQLYAATHPGEKGIRR